jgi:hypothetical protein
MVPVVITGTDFIPTIPGLVARLGGSEFIDVTTATTDTITGTVPAGIPAGFYALTVINPDGQSDTLTGTAPAYTALSPPNPNTTLETGYLATYGPAASGAEGDDDHVQVIFFEVPDGAPGDIYVRIFDADTGGGGPAETIDVAVVGVYGTTITYTLRGDGGYSDIEARSSHPGPAGINAGTLLTRTAIGADPSYHGVWRTVFGPFSADQGELTNGRRVFKLAVEGGVGDDGNRYNVALSTASDDNIAPGGGRIFAYSWTFRITGSERAPLYPYVPAGTQGQDLAQYNWDADRDDGTITLRTPMRTIFVPDGGVSGNSVSFPTDVATSPHQIEGGEDRVTWAVTMDFDFTGANDLTFWAAIGGTDLAIFTQPAMDPPP